MNKFMQLLFLMVSCACATIDAMDAKIISSELDDQLLSAASAGKKERVLELLQQNASVDAQNNFGSTPLLLAAQCHYMDICELLLEHKAQVNLNLGSVGYPNTCLNFAAQWGDKDICKLLIKYKASVDRGLVDSTPLLEAAASGHQDVCQLLLEYNAFVDAKISDGSTALMQAVWRGHKGVCQLLVACKAGIDAQDNNGNTPLMRAAGGQKEVCQMLIEHNASINARNNDGWQPLFFAVAEGQKDTCQLLLDSNAQVNAKADEDYTPLMEAVGRGYNDTEIYKLLLARNAEVNAKDTGELTPLMIAVSWGRNEVCQQLIEHKAGLYAKDCNGWTSLYYACAGFDRYGGAALCQLLLDAMLKPIKESQALVLAFLGIRKYHAPAYMRSLDKNILGLIARQLHEPARQQQLELLRQLRQLKFEHSGNDLWQTLEKHAREELRIPSKMRQEDSDI